MISISFAISAFLLCLGIGCLGIRLAPRLGLLDMPGGRRQHQIPVPRVGGLAVAISILLLTLLGRGSLPCTRLELGAFLAMAVLGFVDDCRELRARWKSLGGFCIAIALAAGAAAHLKGGIPAFDLLGMTVPPLAPLIFGLLVLLFWCLPQAFNLIDGANGLATGYALVVVGSLWAAGAPHARLAGALLACLLLNWPRARIFMGDCGSLSVGLMLVIFAQKVLLLPNPNHLLWLFSYPILDVLMVILIRLIERRPVFAGDRSHLHFQIASRWPTLDAFAVPLLVGIAALCASEVYLAGHWLILPFAGLISLLGLCGFFTLDTALRAWGGERRRGDDALEDSGNAVPAK